MLATRTRRAALVDEVLDYSSFPAEKAPAGAALFDKRPNPQAVERAIDRPRANSDFCAAVRLRCWRERGADCCMALI